MDRSPIRPAVAFAAIVAATAAALPTPARAQFGSIRVMPLGAGTTLRPNTTYPNGYRTDGYNSLTYDHLLYHHQEMFVTRPAAPPRGPTTLTWEAYDQDEGDFIATNADINSVKVGDMIDCTYWFVTLDGDFRQVSGGFRVYRIDGGIIYASRH